ncbi:hypothetical protein SMB554_07985 [Sinorhizobium meliloti]|nr:hypothetical protein SMB554_07985 [Sinorhizobium meliloti]ATA98809.1 hypothetical protein BWO76_21310 [Sinorhizobium meliloti]ATB04825.1 hypothetical protein BWO90_23135 [Sinorhizobium meliloti]RVM51990.1 hypothetical protein CN127_11370 [Sinorhizobium meliloti]
MLVTGIQQRRVCGAEESFQPNDLAWLDSCDRHRNEGGGDARALRQSSLEGRARHLLNFPRPMRSIPRDLTRSTLIPVLVTGIQQRRVCGAGESFQPKDSARLDSLTGRDEE